MMWSDFFKNLEQSLYRASTHRELTTEEITMVIFFVKRRLFSRIADALEIIANRGASLE